jgi:hypothetical protein
MNIEEMRVSLKTIMPDSEVDALTDEEVRSYYFDHFPIEGENEAVSKDKSPDIPPKKKS